jgi:hypothetical protein
VLLKIQRRVAPAQTDDEAPNIGVNPGSAFAIARR